MAARDGVLDADFRARADVDHGAIENHTQCADIDAGARGRGDRHKLHLLGIVEFVAHGLTAVVDVGADRSEPEFVAQTASDREQSVATGAIDVSLDVFDVDFQTIIHNVMIFPQR